MSFLFFFFFTCFSSQGLKKTNSNFWSQSGIFSVFSGTDQFTLKHIYSVQHFRLKNDWDIFRSECETSWTLTLTEKRGKGTWAIKHKWLEIISHWSTRCNTLYYSLKEGIRMIDHWTQYMKLEPSVSYQVKIS